MFFMYNFQKYKISNQYPAKFISHFVPNILIICISEISPAKAMRKGNNRHNSEEEMLKIHCQSNQYQGLTNKNHYSEQR